MRPRHSDSLVTGDRALSHCPGLTWLHLCTPAPLGGEQEGNHPAQDKPAFLFHLAGKKNQSTSLKEFLTSDPWWTQA